MLEEYFEGKNTWKYIMGEQQGRKISQQGILQLTVKTRQIVMHRTSQQFPYNWKMFPNKDQSTRRIFLREKHHNRSFLMHLDELQMSQFINKISWDAPGRQYMSLCELILSKPCYHPTWQAVKPEVTDTTSTYGITSSQENCFWFWFFFSLLSNRLNVLNF